MQDSLKSFAFKQIQNDVNDKPVEFSLAAVIVNNQYKLVGEYLKVMLINILHYTAPMMMTNLQTSLLQRSLKKSS